MRSAVRARIRASGVANRSHAATDRRNWKKSVCSRHSVGGDPFPASTIFAAFLYGIIGRVTIS
jgi:hypothetical protein